MNYSEFAPLQKEKDKICISIIQPTHRLAPDRNVDAAELRKNTEQVKSLLSDNYSIEEYEPLLKRLDALVETIDFNHNMDGLGIFVSTAIQKIIQFNFPVKERVLIDDSFALKELIHLLNLSKEYYVLEINEHETRLFKGILDSIIELKDEYFPKQYEELYEYAKPTRGSSFMGSTNLKDFEKDKSVMEEIRMKGFLHDMDSSLKKYLEKDTPLVLLGVEKELYYFKNVTDYKDNIALEIPGNYTHSTEDELSKLVHSELNLRIDNDRLALVKVLEEKDGEGLTVAGIQDVWVAAQEGRGLKLLVEKDFSQMAYVINDTNSLSFSVPDAPHKPVADAVEAIIKTVLDKGGDIVIMENDWLKQYGRIALFTRY